MELLLYVLSLAFLTLSSYGHYQTSESAGQAPFPGSTARILYDLFGGSGSSILTFVVVVWGFFVFSWWFPVVSLVGALLLAGIVYRIMPFGAVYAVIGFPAGLVFAVLTYANT